MHRSRFVLSLAWLALLGACGSGGGSSAPTPAPGPTPTPAPTPAPTPTPTACSLAARTAFVRDTMAEWYLFPELLSPTTDPAAFGTASAYLNALVAPARAEGKDRFFSGITSIAEENAFFEQGESGGFGFRLGFDTFSNRVLVLETFEGTSALGANIDRGSEILEIRNAQNVMVPVRSTMISGGPAAVFEALGPETPGTTRTLSVRDQSGVERTVTLTKTTFALTPVSSRYGALIIPDGDRKVGYLNLRTFIDPAAPALRDSFTLFQDEGVRDLIVDLRYNGGGALSIAALLGSLMARDLDGRLFLEIAYRPEKAFLNEPIPFMPPAEAIAPRRIAFITTPSTASASEAVINGLLPYFPGDIALIGANTFGKPVGQSPFDLAECGERLRPVTVKLQNADGNGDYFAGLAASVPDTCRAFDDWRLPFGDRGDDMIATALRFIDGRSCQPIDTAGLTASTSPSGLEGGRIGARGMLAAEHPRSVAEREVPGLN